MRGTTGGQRSSTPGYGTLLVRANGAVYTPPSLIPAGCPPQPSTDRAAAWGHAQEKWIRAA